MIVEKVFLYCEECEAHIVEYCAEHAQVEINYLRTALSEAREIAEQLIEATRFCECGSKDGERPWCGSCAPKWHRSQVQGDGE